ncbi:phenylalanine ammonia-lyase [Hyaloscypha variabilis F]|uniref:Phenylalanine ammonia-lyase n=1 Tax=Hyaloscypha variabilis (strain UAMH 11265 / GT02V1 / F) TaxID=1149755 RepID=A0A2J6REC8_HYAVF|nr:phenylalanine ammonia-lyase [Hyaloscypha variabilis F]
MDRSSRPHALATYQAHKTLRKFREGLKIQLDGNALDIATVVAVAKYGCTPHLNLNEGVVRGMKESVELLQTYLAKGFFVYGVNTGFGGSADSRTNSYAALQLALMQHTQSAITTSLDRGGETSLPLQDIGSHAMPYSWVKASMLVRENQTMRGHSAVRVEVVQTLNELICHDIIPLVPLRGSISASGDLMPMSFIAGALQGCPDIFIRTKQGKAYELLPANQALKEAEIEPIVLGPKEGLGLINGTAPSAAVASLALYETHQLAVLSQYLTILASEALGGNLEWLHPFIANIRPHIGQKEAAANMRTFVAGSRLVSGIQNEKDRFTVGLCQDRYATRTSQQWIGPQLEDLMLAHQQVTIELNSTSDNPLVDVSGSDVYSGGNFQAASITSAMEKTRLSLQMLGKMLFGQCTEMINPALNNGLPANLAADNPSLSFAMKGIDTNMAAYMSELAYLANPVSSHVQSAEQHNQAVNSLAFISARYTMTAVDLVSLMSACFIYVGCQGVDLRVMHQTFLESLQPIVQKINAELIGEQLSRSTINSLNYNLENNIASVWAETTSLDADKRCEKVVSSCISILAKKLSLSQDEHFSSVATLEDWRGKMLVAMNDHYISHRARFFEQRTTVDYLGEASEKIYTFVRGELGVPFHRGLIEHPTPGDEMLDGRPKKTIGSWVGIIYESLRDGRLYDKLMEVLAGAFEVGSVVEHYTVNSLDHGPGKGSNGQA